MRKKVYLVLLVLLTIHLVIGMDIVIKNKPINQEVSKNGIVLKQEGSYYSGIKNEPFIPILAKYFSIPKYKKVTSVEVKINSSYTVDLPLGNKIKAQSGQYILSHKDIEIIEQEEYSKASYPDKLLFNSGSNISANENIAYVALYSAIYNVKEHSLTIPHSFTISLFLEDDYSQEYFPATPFTEQVNSQLLDNYTRTATEDKYLIIYPTELGQAYLPLANFRLSQGVELFSQTTEFIYANYNGQDNQAKIRNYIKEVVADNAITHVTLGADIEHIPERRFWAFDCDFSSNDQENHIPADMYYACLNGDWNANGNDLYGEDSDEPDYFPEIVLSRIPARTSAEVQAMVSKIIDYEQVNYPDYSTGLGLSSNLWETSNSVITQQYIEAQYYNDFIENTILYDEDNNVNNAQYYFNQNPNIVQHTGHCFTQVMALEDGLINQDFVNNMTNDYAGVVYSIGCWANALDYDSIAEKLMRKDNHGITTFVGNSRYGWGAPNADAFGFSEFYQKEFFKQLFLNNQTNVASLNQLQKIPFVAYMGGNSVYKWVSYELNTIGDSYFNLIINEPKQLDVTYNSIGDNYYLSVQDNGIEVNDAQVSVNGNVIENNNGTYQFMAEPASIVNVYKYGYYYKTIELESINETGFLSLNYTYQPSQDNPENNIFYKLINSSDEDLNWELRVSYNNSIDENIAYGSLAANSISADLSGYHNFLFPDGLRFTLWDSQEGIIIDSKSFSQDSPSLNLTINTVETQVYPLVYEQSNQLSFSLNDDSSYPNIGRYNLSFTSDDFTISPETITDIEDITQVFNLELSPLSSNANIGVLNVDVTMQFDDVSFNQSLELPLAIAESSFHDDFEESPIWFSENQWQRTTDQALDSDYSLTCRPQDYGDYVLDLPLVTFTEQLALSFDYKYNMPMYGSDGISLYLVHGDVEERLLFLGSGGALEGPTSRNNYIFGDWANYTLNLNDNILNRPALGDEIIIRFVYTYMENEDIPNDYYNNPELGTFIDNLSFITLNNTPNSDDIITSESNPILIYPNPSTLENLKIEVNDRIGNSYELKVYNIKGQLVNEIKGQLNNKDSKLIQFNDRASNKSNLSSGIYLIQYKSVDIVETRKILILNK